MNNLIDINKLDDKLNNKDLKIRLLNKFIDNKIINDFYIANNDNNIDNLKNALHDIKGMSGNLELTLLYESSKNLEILFKNIKDINNIKDSISNFIDIYKTTKLAVIECLEMDK